MSARGIIVVCFSIWLQLNAFLIPYIANHENYSLEWTSFYFYLNSGLPLFILSILSFVILIKKDLKIETIIRRTSGILCAYFVAFYQDFQIFSAHQSPIDAIWRLSITIAMLPILYFIGYIIGIFIPLRWINVLRIKLLGMEQ